MRLDLRDNQYRLAGTRVTYERKAQGDRRNAGTKTLAERRGIALKQEHLEVTGCDYISTCPRPEMDRWWKNVIVKRCEDCNRELQPGRDLDPKVCRKCLFARTQHDNERSNAVVCGGDLPPAGSDRPGRLGGVLRGKQPRDRKGRNHAARRVSGRKVPASKKGRALVG